MDKKVYHNILVHYGVSSGPELISRGFIYQQDIDPNHKSKLCRHYLTKKKRMWSSGPDEMAKRKVRLQFCWADLRFNVFKDSSLKFYANQFSVDS